MMEVFIVILTCVAFWFYYKYIQPEREEAKREKIRTQNIEKFQESASGKIETAKGRYYSILNTLKIPENASKIDVETTVFGKSCRAESIIGKKGLKNNFYLWHDDDNLYMFPTQDHLSPSQLSEIGYAQFDPWDIRLIAIPKDSIVQYSLIGENDVRLIDRNANKPNITGAIIGGAVGGETGALIGAMSPKRSPDLTVFQFDDRRIEIAYEEDGLLKKINVSTTASPFLEKWIPEKEYSQVMYQKTKPEQDSPVDGIVKYKELLDKGIITQEEYDRKKKELLKL